MSLISKNTSTAQSENDSATAVVSVQSDKAIVSFTGDWLLSNKRTDAKDVEKSLVDGVKIVSFDTTQLGKYDSALISVLFKLSQICKEKNIDFDIDSLPKGPRELIQLALAVPEVKASDNEEGAFNFVYALGHRTVNFIKAVELQCGFIGEVTVAFLKALVGKARYRKCDLLSIIQQTGPEALPIVALISFLIGLILAFVGAIQLAKYGSEIFVADLVGIAMVREMGAIMVGIVMSGRTGASFAAELGSMKVNEEISAFRTFGISPIEFLVLPRMVALILMFPFLTIFADVIGMLGGFVIGAGMFDISYDQYVNRTLASLDLVQISTGFFKSFIFGIIVACVGCKQGMQCENSSSGVGMATTTSVVQSITLIIVADAVFAVILAIFGI